MGHIGSWKAQDYRLFAVAGLFAMVLPAFSTPCHGQADNVQRFDLRIENGRLTENRKVIAVKRDDRVEINWRADRRTVLHLHGYDIEIAAGPDKPETMSFVARATGRFAIETHAPAGEGKHGGHAVLIYLEVHPR
jgi:hypothetical protein